MPNYLLEIGTEELPAYMVPEAQERLKALMSNALGQAHLSFDDIITYGTPRRIACIVRNLAAIQPTTSKKVKGPPVKSSFDKDGKPLPPALGFAQKQGTEVEQLAHEEIGGITHLVANLTIEGQPAEAVLSQLVPRVITDISGERLMRWGSSELKFSRPIRWLVSLLDGKEVRFSLQGLQSGRHTFGHRILAPGPVPVENPEAYVDALRRSCVLACPQERKQVIEAQVVKAAENVSGRARQLKGSLLEEVINITEWPSAVLGEFAREYLDLPDTLIETIMVHHQRYFPVEAQPGPGLLPYFISVANNDKPGAAPQIKQGNERVLRARLADGRFFYFDDQKTALSCRRESLSQLTFHEGLGSYAEKQERLVNIARSLSKTLGLADKISICLERALELSKLDLVTSLVRELPELQGHVGSWYARQEGEPPEVVAAIASHYSPRSTDDAIPQDTVGQIAAVIDKMDNLVCLFATGKRPSGSSDPYILRRQAQGLVDILMDGLSEYAIDLSVMVDHIVFLLEPRLKANKRWSDGQTARKGIADLREFLLQRVKLKLVDSGFKREVLDAVLNCGDPLANLPDIAVRCRVIEEILKADNGGKLIVSGARIGNILEPESQPGEVDATHLEHAAEKALWTAINAKVIKKWQKNGNLRVPSKESEYTELLQLLSGVTDEVDAFFAQVMVNDKDPMKRENRHALLKSLDRYFRCLADFPKLLPLVGYLEHFHAGN